MMKRTNKYVIIGMSPFGNPLSNFFKSLGEGFERKGYRVIYLWDGKIINDYKDYNNFKIIFWPSKRPTKLKDFIFYVKLLIQYRPVVTISNFGSTNIMSLAGRLFKTENVLNYVHSPSLAFVELAKSYRFRYLEARKRFVYSWNTNLLTNSYGMAHYIKSHYRYKNDIIPIPLLIEDKSNITSFKGKIYDILIVGGLNENKRQLDFLRLLTLNNKRLKVGIVGSGRMKEKLEKYIVTEGLSDSVDLIGNVSNQIIHSILLESKILVSCSKYEAFGINMIEALRASVPILATSTYGSIDIVEVGYNGEFFDFAITDDFEYKFKKIVKSYNIYSKNARLSFEQKFQLSTKNIDNYIDLIIN